MALQMQVSKSVEGFTGQLTTTGYWKVTQIAGDKTKITGVITAFSGESVVDSFEFDFAPSLGADASDFIAQAYQHLKTTEKFATAADA